MKKNIVITYPAPTVKNIFCTPSEDGESYSKVHLLLYWGKDMASVTITKVKNGYEYVDYGVFTRVFPTVESLCWEFELPEKVKRELKLLK